MSACTIYEPGANRHRRALFASLPAQSNDKKRMEEKLKKKITGPEPKYFACRTGTPNVFLLPWLKRPAGSPRQAHTRPAVTAMTTFLFSTFGPGQRVRIAMEAFPGSSLPKDISARGRAGTLGYMMDYNYGDPVWGWESDDGVQAFPIQSELLPLLEA